MKEAIIEIIKWIRESIRPVVVILVLAAIILFFPHSWTSSVGLGDGFSKYRFVAFLFFVGSIVWLLSFPIERQFRSRSRLKYFSQLTQQERDALRFYIQNRKRTQYFGWKTIDVARSLARADILIETSTKDVGASEVCFEIALWAYSYLCEHPELVGAPK
jgi:hypothetical protein